MHINEIVIDMTEDGWDVNEEYERLFGSAKRVNLFDSEEEYEEIRQFVIEQFQLTFVNPAMPFEGVCKYVRSNRIKNKKKDILIKNELAQLIQTLKDYSLVRNCKGEKRDNFHVKEPHEKMSESHTSFINESKVVDPVFSHSPQKVITEERSPRYYFIKRENGNRSCSAKGVYDKIANKFVILKDSELACEVTSKYRFSASDIKRKKIIQQYCDSKYVLKLKQDVMCNTPDEAACFVLGDFANGWSEWKSKDGLSLESYISKVHT